MLKSTIQTEVAQRIEQKATLFPNIVQACERLCGQLGAKRHYVEDQILNFSGFEYTKQWFDPRFLIFEFTWNILLRRKQVEIVRVIVHHVMC